MGAMNGRSRPTGRVIRDQEPSSCCKHFSITARLWLAPGSSRPAARNISSNRVSLDPIHATADRAPCRCAKLDGERTNRGPPPATERGGRALSP
jgi:hypothetical protein